MVNDWFDPGEPQPWGVVHKDPLLQLEPRDMAALIKVGVIEPTEARRALGLPERHAADELEYQAALAVQMARLTVPQPYNGMPARKAGVKIGEVVATFLFGHGHGRHRGHGHYLSHRAFHILKPHAIRH